MAEKSFRELIQQDFGIDEAMVEAARRDVEESLFRRDENEERRREAERQALSGDPKEVVGRARMVYDRVCELVEQGVSSIEVGRTILRQFPDIEAMSPLLRRPQWGEHLGQAFTAVWGEEARTRLRRKEGE